MKYRSHNHRIVTFAFLVRPFGSGTLGLAVEPINSDSADRPIATDHHLEGPPYGYSTCWLVPV